MLLSLLGTQVSFAAHRYDGLYKCFGMTRPSDFGSSRLLQSLRTYPSVSIWLAGSQRTRRSHGVHQPLEDCRQSGNHGILHVLNHLRASIPCTSMSSANSTPCHAGQSMIVSIFSSILIPLFSPAHKDSKIPSNLAIMFSVAIAC